MLLFVNNLLVIENKESALQENLEKKVFQVKQAKRTVCRKTKLQFYKVKTVSVLYNGHEYEPQKWHS